jgi:hypothetical protein
MRLLAAGLAVLILAAAFALGWRTAAAPPEVVAVPARRGPPGVAPADPNPRGRFGVQLLAAGLTDPPPGPLDIEAAAARQSAAPSPPEPDVGEAFRRQLTAVVAQRAGGPYYALLSGDGGRQALRPGDAYQFGWRLAGLDLKQAVFARGRERRSIDLFAQPTAAAGAPSEPAAEAPAASSPPGGVSEPPLD